MLPQKLNFLLRFLILVSLLGSFMLAFYTFHDLQTAEGAGLYLSITFHHSSRVFFDAVVDLAGIILLLFVTILPLLIMKRISLDSYFRFFSIYLAFMPIVHPGNVVHLMDALRSISIRPNLLNGHLLDYIFQDLFPLFDMLKWFLPFVLLIYALNKSSNNLKTTYRIWFAIFILLFLLCFCLIENIAFVFLYLVYYLLFLWCFKEMETFFIRFPIFALWSNILFFGCLLRGIYRMLQLISITHI